MKLRAWEGVRCNFDAIDLRAPVSSHSEGKTRRSSAASAHVRGAQAGRSTRRWRALVAGRRRDPCVCARGSLQRRRCAGRGDGERVAMSPHPGHIRRAGCGPTAHVQPAQKKNPATCAGFCFDPMAERTGLEPATSGVTGQHSNQLNYRSTLETWCVVGAEGFEPPTLSV